MFLADGAPRGWQVSVQNTVQIGEFSAPEPDLALLRPRADDYAKKLPQADDVALLIEIADSSLSYDRGRKLELYARAKIPVVWIVNVAEQTIETYSKPARGRYRTARTVTRSQSLVVPEISGLKLKLAELFAAPDA